MSQHPAATTPAPVVNLTEPTASTADPLLDEARSALELAEWTPQDQLSIYTHGLVAECTCGCRHSTTVTGNIAADARDIVTLAVTATNLLPRLVERIATGREQDAQVIASLSDTVLKVAGELGVTSVTGSTDILRTLRRALHDGVAAQARAERLQRELDEAGRAADRVRRVVSSWGDHPSRLIHAGVARWSILDNLGVK